MNLNKMDREHYKHEQSIENVKMNHNKLYKCGINSNNNIHPGDSQELPDDYFFIFGGFFYG